MALPLEKSYTIEDIYALPQGQRAELIDGQMYMMVPPKRVHQKLVSQFTKVIGSYIDSKHGDCEVYPAPFAVFLNEDDRNYVEPDISVICDKSKLNDKGCNGAPDWIIEIVSPSNAKHDYITKLSLYSNANVREYWIIDAEQNKIYVYDLQDNKLVLSPYTFRDKIKAGIYEDFYIDFSDLNLNI